MDGLLAGLARNQVPAEAWTNLHLAAVRDDRLGPLADAYVAVAQGKRIRAAPPQVAAEFFFRAGLFFADAASDVTHAMELWHRALVAFPAHAEAFGRLESALIDAGQRRAQADLYVTQAHARPRAEQPDLLRRAVSILEGEPGTEAVLIEHYQEILRLDARDDETRTKLEERLLAANRPRDVARLLEQALVGDPPPGDESAREIRARLIELYSGPLAELERTMPHVEALLLLDPEHDLARAVAQRLLEVKALAGRAAAALALATEATGTPADVAKMLALELEHTRGPKRKDVLRRLGVVRQDGLEDEAGAFEVFEQALALDASDDDVVRRYVSLAGSLNKQVDAGRSLARFAAAARDPLVRARLSTAVGDLYLAGGDPKRARASFVAVLGMPDLPNDVLLRVSRSLCAIYASERDFRSLADSLERVAQLETDPDLRQTANEELAELAQGTLRDAARAIAAWRRLVDTPARRRALDALEPLYNATGAAVDLAFVLEERSKDEPDAGAARTLAFRAAEVLTSHQPDRTLASDAWARFSARFGADRQALAAWLPLLEAEGDWARMAMALEGDASLAPADERATILARLGQVRLQRLDDIPGAIDAFSRALEADPSEAVSRTTLEKLAAAGSHRLEAARVLEPYYREEEHVAGILRVLDLKASTSPSHEERIGAIEEAVTLVDPADAARTAEWLARGLREAIDAGSEVASWIDRLESSLGATDGRRLASLLARALGDRAIDSPDLHTLARRAAETHLAAGDVPAGLALYRRALANDPGSRDLIERVDELLRQQGTPEERVALYQAALVQGPTAERRAELLRAIALIERNDLRDAERAIKTYEIAASEAPSDPAVRTALAELYAETARWATLLALLERSLAGASPETVLEIRARMAEVALNQGDATLAREHVRAVVDDPGLRESEAAVVERVARGLEDSVLLRAVLGRRASLAPDPVDQIAWLDQLGSLELSCAAPDLAVASWKRAAAAAEAMADEREARRLYERARDVTPDDPETAYRLADLLERAEDWAPLPDLYAVMLEHSQMPAARVAVLMRHARLLAEHLDDLGSALVSAAQAFELASGSSEYREVLSTFTMLALRGKATRIFAQAMDEAIDRNAGRDADQTLRRTELRMAKARVLAANREGRDGAVAAYRAILEDEGVPEAQVKTSLHALESLLSSEPPDARRGDRRWLFGWRAERGSVVEQAAALEAWAAAEESAFDEKDRALDLYRRAVALEPDNVRALSAVARLSLGLGDAEGAVAALIAQRDRSEGPARRAIELELASTLLHRLDRPKDALTEVAHLLEGAPEDPRALALARDLLSNAATRDAMVAVLEAARRHAEGYEARTGALRTLLDATSDGKAPADVRRAWFEALVDAERGGPEPARALAVVLAAAEEQPEVSTFWDHAEQLAREEHRPAEVADAYRRAIAQPLSVELTNAIGERGVAFHEEWFEDGDGVVRILERVLEVDSNAQWAFDRLKLLLDSGERWTELFALYDRTILVADDARKAALYEDAAQIAKDFANDSDRAVSYLEKLLVLRPTAAHLVASLERLYERKGAFRELVALLSKQVASQSSSDARRTRSRVAQIWLDELKDPGEALAVVEALWADAGAGRTPEVVTLLERVMAAAPSGTAAEGQPTPVRYRAASMLRAHFEAASREADLARILEVELEVATSPADVAAAHRTLASLFTKLANLPAALDHIATLALLEPADAGVRAELESLATKLGRFDRLAEVLTGTSQKAPSDSLRAELMIAAGDVWVSRLRDEPRAISAYLGVIAASASPSAMVLDAARKVEPLLERAGRAWELLDVLERLADLEESHGARARARTLAARLATSLGDLGRGIAAWRALLASQPDAEALDALIELLERDSRWKELGEALEQRASTPRSPDQTRADRARIARNHEVRLLDLDAAIAAWQALERDSGPSDESTDALCDLLERKERWAELDAKLVQAADAAASPERRAQLHARSGDVLRTHGGDAAGAWKSYDAALREDPREARARAGLLALAELEGPRRDAVRTLLDAYNRADEWERVVELHPLRLVTAPDDDSKVSILTESARLAEQRGDDAGRAFDFFALAFGLAPTAPSLVDELTRLAEASGRWQAYVAVHERALVEKRDLIAADALALAAFHLRVGVVRDERLGDGAAALDDFERASVSSPADVSIALAALDAAARQSRWSSVAATVVRACRALGVAVRDVVDAAERQAQQRGGWDGLAAALAKELASTEPLDPAIARDLEAQLAVWHRDRRGDPDAAEEALVRALSHDGTNADLLSSLAALQRRAKGRPLVDSLVRLSQATGGDLELLREAADVALSSLADRGLARAILESLIELAERTWRADPSLAPGDDADEVDGPVSVGATGSPAATVRWAIQQLGDLHTADAHPDRTVDLLKATARLPWERSESRQMLHQAASLARTAAMDAPGAVAIYEGLIATDLGDRPAVVALEALYTSLERREDLLSLYARLVERATEPTEKVELRLTAATLEASASHPESAEKLLRANLAELPRNAPTVVALERVLDQGARHADLAELYVTQAELAEAAAAGTEAVSFWVRAARVAEARLADPDRSVRYFRRALASSEDAESLDALARLLGARADHAEAADMLGRRLAIAEAAERPRLTLSLVEELLAAGEPMRAREELERALAALPDEDVLVTRLVALYGDQAAWDSLAGLHRDRAARASDRAAKLMYLRTAADLYIRRCRTPEAAIPLLEEAAQLDPEDRVTKLILADALVNAGQFPAARAIIRSVVDGFGGRRPRERGIAHYHSALLEIATGNRPQALTELEAATKIDPGNARILRALAELAREDGQLDRAERSYRALLVALKRPEDATDDSEIVRAEVLLELSAIASVQGQADRARELVESALESASKSAVESRRLEATLREKKDFTTLVRALDARVARAGSDAERVDAIGELARVLDVELGHLADAFTARQQILALTPASPKAHEASLALARRVDGLARYADDVDKLAAAAEHDSRAALASSLYLRSGEVYERDLADAERAVAAYERSLACALLRPATDSQPPSSITVPGSVSRPALLAIRALDAAYAKVGRADDRARVLARRVELESTLDDPKAAADARFGLAEVVLGTSDGALEGGLLITQALDLDLDFDRADGIVRRGLARHPSDGGLIDLLERVGRGEGREATLLDALSLRASLPGAAPDVTREGVAVALKLGRPDEAEALLRRYVASDDARDLAWALEELARLREASGDFVGAVDWKRRAADAALSADARRLRFEMAQLMASRVGDVAGAAVVYEGLFDEDPTDRAAFDPMLEAYRSLDDAASLVRLLARVIEQVDTDDERSRLRFERARLLVKPLGQREEAISALTDLVTDDPNQVGAAALLGELLEADGRREELRDLLSRQIDAAKDRQDLQQVEALSLRRATSFEADDVAEARATLYSALDWTPESRPVLEHLVRLLQEPGFEGELLDAKEKLLAVAPRGDVERIALELHDQRLAEGGQDAALRVLEVGFRANASSVVLRERLEAAYTAANATGKLAELKALAAKELTDPVARATHLREVATLYREVGDHAREAAALREALAGKADDFTLATELVAALVKAQDVVGAIAAIEMALALVRDGGATLRAPLMLERATLRVELGEDEAAAADLIAVARLGASHVSDALDVELERLRARAEARGDAPVERTMRLELATVRAETGDLDGARPLLAELLRREPKDRDALRLLARIEERAERWDAATVAYRRLIPLEEGDLAVDTALRLADACERAGRLADARGALERTRLAAPNDAALRLRLERLYESIGAFRELAELSFGDARLAPDDQGRCAHLKRAGSLLLQDGTDTEAAIDALTEAHNLASEDIECAVLLADAYTVAGRADEARALVNAQITARGGRRSPELASLYHRLARIANSVGDRPAELAALTSGLEADAQNGFLASELAGLALEVGDIEVAARALRSITLLKDASSSSIPRALAYQYLGEIARQQGDAKRAMVLFKRAVDDDPTLESARELIEELRAAGG